MQFLRWSCCLLAGIALARAAEPLPAKVPASTVTELGRLLDGFPRPEPLLRARDVIKRTPGVLNEKAAREMVRIAEERIPRLRALLKPGTSVFDYPGLLMIAAKVEYGPIRKVGPEKFESGYIFYFGVFLGDEFVGPSDFYLWTDDRGVITEITNVDWKR